MTRHITADLVIFSYDSDDSDEEQFLFNKRSKKFYRREKFCAPQTSLFSRLYSNYTLTYTLGYALNNILNYTLDYTLNFSVSSPGCSYTLNYL